MSISALHAQDLIVLSYFESEIRIMKNSTPRGPRLTG